MNDTKRTRRQNRILFVVLLAVAFLYSPPTLAMIGTAFKGPAQALSNNALFPLHPELTSFRTVLESDFLTAAANSMKVCLCVTVSCIVLAILAGYALSRFRGKVFSFYQMALLVVQMFPMMLLMLPLFLIFKAMGLLDTHWSIILSYTCLNLPFSIWMIKGFFDTIPYDIEESALIDGCGRFQTLCRIVLPVSLPGVATVGIFTFLNAWNEFTYANTFIRSDDLLTLTVHLQHYVSANQSSWAEMMAASTLGIIPSMIFLLCAQKYLVQGMTAGSVKG